MVTRPMIRIAAAAVPVPSQSSHIWSSANSPASHSHHHRALATSSTSVDRSSEWDAARAKPFGVGVSIMVPGTGKRSHLLTHNDNDMYQCDCIGWRQSKQADLTKRTCKHLKLYFGVAKEHERVGLPAPTLEELKTDEQKAEEKEAKHTAREEKAAAKTAAADAKSAAKEAKAAAKPTKKRATKKAAAAAVATKAKPTKTAAAAASSSPSSTATTVPVADGVADAIIVDKPSKKKATKATKTTASSSSASDTMTTPAKKTRSKRSAAMVDVNKNDYRSEMKQPEPPMLLAEKYEAGWWLSEKLDGVRAWWSGSTRMLISRSGQMLRPPAWFIEQLPNEALDGELWTARGKFSQTAGTLNRLEAAVDDWKVIKFVVFDAPEVKAPFEQRVQRVRELLDKCTYAVPIEQQQCTGRDHLTREVERVLAAGGEGVMLREAGSAYVDGRSSTLLKAKKYYDDEGIILAHEEGKGRNDGRMGAVMIRLKSGRQTRLGSGFNDEQREQPPPVGTVVTFRYSDITVTGLPRFAVFVRTRDDMTAADFERAAATFMAANPTAAATAAAPTPHKKKVLVA